MPNDPGVDGLHRGNLERRSFARIHDAIDVPTLIETQINSFEWFRREGLRELFDEISPITDFTGKNMELRFLDYTFGEPRYDEYECRERDMTFAAPLRVNVYQSVRTDTFALTYEEYWEGFRRLFAETDVIAIGEIREAPRDAVPPQQPVAAETERHVDHGFESRMPRRHHGAESQGAIG